MSAEGGDGMSARQLVVELELVERLAPLLDEIDVLQDDTDVVRTICEGLVEDLRRVACEHEEGSA